MNDRRPLTPFEADPLIAAFLAALKLPSAERDPFVSDQLRGDERALAEVRDWLRAVDEDGPIPDVLDHALTAAARRDFIGSTPTPDSKYGDGKRITTGGMGSILFVQDPVLRRTVCMKVARGEERRGGTDFVPPAIALVERLVREAAITGRLEHPGIVPVYELGQQQNGRVYFIMQRVQGEDLADALRRHRKGDPTWTLPRLVEVLLRVCETVAFAHDRGVIHRDLKPANIRLGEFGQVYVLDWGLARVIDVGRFEQGVSEVGLESLPSQEFVSADVFDAAHNLSSPGSALGTPGYMAPEQARGESGTSGYAVDVYSLGAVLYELLAGRRPYVRDGESPSAVEMTRRLAAGPPEPLAQSVGDAAPELVAICERAMQREPSERYADVRELARELRRYVEGRAVHAHRTGPWIDARKWVARNRALAAALAAVLVVLITGGFVAAFLQDARLKTEQRRNDERQARVASEELAAIPLVAGESARRLELWIERTEELVARVPGYAAELAELRRRGTELVASANDAPSDAREADNVLLRQQLPKIENVLRVPAAERSYNQRAQCAFYPYVREAVEFADSLQGEPRAFEFESEADRIEHDALATLVFHGLECAGPHVGSLARARAKLALVQSFEQLGSDPKWQECIRSVSDRGQCPAYNGLALKQQRGLLPLRRDPTSGLWEFLHVPSGSAPPVDTDGEYELGPDSGIVLVLVPGGSSLLGAREPIAGVMSHTELSERPLLEVQLAPFFIAKYELTQAQWYRLCGSWPSYLRSGSFDDGVCIGPTHPVESIDRDTSEQFLAAVGLTLPTEAQWEWSARAGDNDPANLANVYWDEAESATRYANLAEAAAPSNPAPEDPPVVKLTDGWLSHAPVGSYPPNGFGLCDVLGNVSEWCLDWRVETFTSKHTISVHQGSDGLLGPIYAAQRVSRGGSFALGSTYLRFSSREARMPLEDHTSIGVRAARVLDR